jgi:hypothetical protein
VQTDKWRYCIHVIYVHKGILEKCTVVRKPAQHYTGFMFTFIKAKKYIQAYRAVPFLFTSTTSANVIKSLCPLLFWPLRSYPFVVQRHLLKLLYIFPIPPNWRRNNWDSKKHSLINFPQQIWRHCIHLSNYTRLTTLYNPVSQKLYPVHDQTPHYRT